MRLWKQTHLLPRNSRSRGGLAAGLSLFMISITACSAAEVHLEKVEAEDVSFRVVKVVDGLDHPWALAFLPDGRMLITERPGKMRIFDGENLTELEGLPEVTAQGQGGLMEVILHPNYEENGWIYFTYAASYDNGVGTRLARARLEENRLVDVENLFQMNPPGSGGVHYGSRLVFDKNGYLFMTLGERGDRHRSQQLDSHHGTTLRLNEDGTVPDDNPFVGQPNAHPEIYSYGHRNAQGMAYDPETDRLWQNEHGPRGGDELNLVKRGKNYGWPLATYGEEYRGGTIGTTPDRFEGEVVQPVIHWTPSIAVSGMTLYTGEAFPKWKGNLFVGALRQQHIRRLVLEGEKVVHQEELLRDKVGRIRSVVTGPEGHLWVTVDQPNGAVYRIEPAPEAED
jgi:aldose sugar dehydrogenase